ncbi:hypothetical protein Pfo_012653 [Paulownia fortunei]|nr:hypothetical protein Pfo_012653 [Paulownia fortunei]
MTFVEGRVIGPPDLKLGAPDGTVDIVRVENEKCQLRAEDFIKNLRNRSRSLGICMEEPLLCHLTGMREFSSVSRLEELLRSVVQETSRKSWNKLQIIICVMAEKYHGYKYLKWVSETRIGVVTQCCLSMHSNRGDDQFLGNLCLKINAKLRESNVELSQRLPHFEEEDHVMFIGADVNHPVSKKSTTPSIAAVVSTVNWPPVNRYAARVKPKKTVVFRDDVSEGQFDMVLNEELSDLKSAICDDNYQPTITLVVAQKRRQTWLFLENVGDGGPTGNAPPGTVVDTKIVHPFDTRPVSLVPPVYYADLVAYRGGIFQEVAKEFQSRSLPSSVGPAPLFYDSGSSVLKLDAHNF